MRLPSRLNKPKGNTESSKYAFQMAIKIALVTLCQFTPLVAAQDTTPLPSFELLFPANHSTAYATKFGDKPRLAWQEPPNAAVKIDHYEVWLDGVNVDRIPASGFGHLPGENVGNYEPFRPFGSLPEEKIRYYTPSVSNLPPGAHQWYVNAVDQDGNKRRSDSTFHFTVEDFGSPKVFVSQLGYLSNEKIRVIVDASVGASSFNLIDLKGAVVFSGTLKSDNSAFGNQSIGEFSATQESGTYQIKAGSAYSIWFPIGLEAQLNYEDFLRKYRNVYRKKRCGDTTVNCMRKACHLEDARMDGDNRHEIVGGWHASSDLRKIMRILQPGLHGLIELKKKVNPAWDHGDYNILDEIKWGNQYFHKMQLENGSITQHYYLWCGASDWGESLNRYTNNVIGDSDDRVLPEKTLAIDMLTQSSFIMNQTAIYRAYKNQEPEYAQKCLDAAQKCYEYFVKTWPVVSDYKTTFNARPYIEPVSELMPLAYGMSVNLSMYLATNHPEYQNQAVALADSFMALQETRFIDDQKEVKGFFYSNTKKDTIFSSLMGHGAIDGVEGAVMVLADLCESLPEHPKLPAWKECLRSYLEDHLLPLSEKNAFGIVPAYVSRTNQAGGQTDAKMQHHVGGLHYQYLCDNRGVNMILARQAILLARGAKILRKPKLREAAWRQIEWILGNNPLNASTVYGVGHGQPAAYKEELEPPSDGMVLQGIGGQKNDMPYLQARQWRWAEMELHNTAWFAQAIFELLPEQKHDPSEK